MKTLIHRIRWGKVIKFLIVIIIFVAGAYLGYQYYFADKVTASSAETKAATVKAEKRTITNVLSGSGTIEPLHTYDVTTLVDGKVISADFEVGDTVKKGQVLYQITTDTLDSQIDHADTTFSRANESYEKAKKSYQKAVSDYAEASSDYQKAKKKYGNPKEVSTEAGIVKKLYVKEGDIVQKGSQIAEIYDNTYMLLTIPFSADEVKASLIGKTATVTMDNNSETINGTVTKISSIDEAFAGNQISREVTIQVKNPGGITAGATATAAIGSLSGTAQGSFQVLTDTIITSAVSGEIASLKLKEGSSISKGDVIFALTQDSVDSQLQSYSKAVDAAQDVVDNAQENVDKAKETIEDAKSSLEDVIDEKADYSITAPIAGKIVSKSALVGDTIKGNSSNSSSLCTIYDLSSVTFSMNVDELDILEVKEGQKVSITADALEGQEITGVVTNVSLESNASSGVTQYPVTIQIDQVGKLLPGMNVTGKVVIEEAKNCLAIPSDALRRGNMVYVKDDTVTEASGNVPAGFKKVQVETGLTDGDYVEITSGLTGSEEVYVERNISAEASGTKNSMFGGFGTSGKNNGEMQGPPGSGWNQSSRTGNSRSGSNRSGNTGSSGFPGQ